MRDLEILNKEAEALDDVKSSVWFSELTPKERALFIGNTTALLEEIRQFWEDGVLPVLQMLWESVSSRITTIREIDTSLK